MRVRVAAALLVVALSGVSPQTAPDVVRMIEADGVAAKYWPRWRGPSGQGLVPDGPYPDRWSAKENVVWRTPVAGRGNSSPIVWGDRIYLTTAYDGGQRSAIVGFRRSDGKQLFETFVPQRDVESGHPKNSHASATAVTDGRRVYASFGSHGLLAVDLEGKFAWHRPIGRLANAPVDVLRLDPDLVAATDPARRERMQQMHYDGENGRREHHSDRGNGNDRAAVGLPEGQGDSTQHE